MQIAISSAWDMNVAHRFLQHLGKSVSIIPEQCSITDSGKKRQIDHVSSECNQEHTSKRSHTAAVPDTLVQDTSQLPDYIWDEGGPITPITYAPDGTRWYDIPLPYDEDDIITSRHLTRA